MKKCILETIGKIQMFFVLLELKIQRRWPIHIQITIWGLISMIFVFFLSYLEIFSIPLIKVFNILGFNDMPAGNSEGFFSFIISRFLYCSVDVSVWFIIPLLITLYYFYYRQQRAISESYLTRNDISVLKLGLSVFLAILAIYINNIKGVTTIGTVVVCLGAIIWSGLFVKFVFNHLKAEYVFQHNAHYIHKLVNLLSFNNSLKDEDWDLICDEINWRFDIAYQILRYIINCNLKTIYKNVLQQMCQEIEYLNTIIFKEQFGVNSEKVLKVYKNILINYDSFCKLVYNNNYDEFSEAIEQFFSFYPKEIENLLNESPLSILYEFYCAIWDICRFLANHERSYFQKLVQRLIELGETTQKKKAICIVFKSLVVNAVEKNNLNFLTEICYYQMKFIEKLKNKQKTCFISKNEGNSIEQKMISKYLKGHENPYQYYQGILLYELLQASVKTIELGEYRLTGFLVKYTISNYSKELIRSIVDKLLDNKIYIDKKLNGISLSDRLTVYFSINPQTANYCMKKLIVLLNAQYYYRNHLKYKNKLIFGADIFNNSDDAFTEEYCIQKILKVGDEYGMLSIDILKHSWIETCKKEFMHFIS